MLMLCTGCNYGVTKEKFPHNVEMDNKGILLFYCYYYYSEENCLFHSHWLLIPFQLKRMNCLTSAVSDWTGSDFRYVYYYYTRSVITINLINCTIYLPKGREFKKNENSIYTVYDWDKK